jgi:hypothetical protein
MKRQAICAFLGVVALLTATTPTRTSLGGAGGGPAGEGGTAVEGTRQIREFMKDGAARFAHGDWEGARLAYLKAWEIKQHPAVAANMAAAEMKLGRYRDAAEHLKYALKRVPMVQTEKREAVETQLNECRPHLAAVTVTSNVAGTDIIIDTLSVGQSPLEEEILLDPGKHKIEASHAGYQFDSRDITAAAGETIPVAIELHEKRTPLAPHPALSTATAPPAKSQASSQLSARTWTILGGTAATVVSLGVGIVFRIKSSNDDDDAKSLKAQLNSESPSLVANKSVCASPTPSAICDSLHEKLANYDRDRNLSTGAFVASGLFAMATVATVLCWPTKGQAERRAAGSLQLTPWLAGGSQGIRASLRF